MSIATHFKPEKRLSDFHYGFVMAFIFLGDLFAFAHKGNRDCLTSWHGSYEDMDEKQCKKLSRKECNYREY